MSIRLRLSLVLYLRSMSRQVAKALMIVPAAAQILLNPGRRDYVKVSVTARQAKRIRRKPTARKIFKTTH